MSSVSSVSSSSYSSSSIYGNRNVLSGLASGLDTETMIENSISGYTTKIQSLIQQQTKLTWKQDAFRGITDQLIALSQKYTSYTSKTNLSSPSFFSNAVITSTGGEYKDLVSATGKATSDIQLNAVQQLASAARYSVSAANLNTEGTVGEAIDWSKTVGVSDMSGSMTLTYGTRTISLNFSETETVGSAQELADLISSKLAGQTISTSSGDTVAANTRIGVAVSDNGAISFSDLSGAGNSVYISSVSGDLKKNGGLSIETGSSSDGKGRSFKVTDASQLSHEADMAEYLSDKTIRVTLDGVTKEISLGTIEGEDQEEQQASLLSNLQANLKSAFGSKVTVDLDEETGGLSFTAKSGGSSLKVASDVSEALGLGKNGVSSYLNTSKTLGEALGDTLDSLEAATDEDGNELTDEDGNKLYDLVINGTTVGQFTKDTALESVLTAINNSDAGVKVSYSTLTDKLTFTTTETGADAKIEIGEGLGTALFGSASLNLSGEDGNGMLLDNDGEKAYSIDETTGEKYYVRYRNGVYYRADENGVLMKDENRQPITVDEDDPVFITARTGYTAGQDAIVNVTVNGDNLTLTRSSNVIDMDGLSVTLKGTFNEDLWTESTTDEDGNVTTTARTEKEIAAAAKKLIAADKSVTFTTKADSDKIVDAVSSFVEEFNSIMQSVHDAYTTQPLTDSSNNSYEPLTDDDKEGMTETQIANYEEKAKTGLLFGDSDLTRLYSRLYSAITPGGTDRKAMEAIGLTTSYSNGVTTLSLDEDKLREALETNADSVKNVFAGSTSGGSTSSGLIATVKKTLDSYASTSYGSYGILVRRAGTTTSSLSLMDNSIQQQIDNLDDQIDRWQDKMSDKIDYYTTLFTKMEQLMAQMNSQSSALASLTGYSSY